MSEVNTTPDRPTLNAPDDQQMMRWIGYGLLFLFFVWLAWRIREILPLFIMGLLLAYLFDPLLDKLQKRGWSRLRSVWFVFLIFFLLFLTLLLFVIPATIAQVQNAIANASLYQAKLIALVAKGENYVDLRQLPLPVQEAIQHATARFQEIAPVIARHVGVWLKDAVASLFLMLILPIITFYFMIEFDPIRLKALSMFPNEYQNDVVEMSGQVNQMLSRYVRGQILVSTLVALSAFVILSVYAIIFKMKYTLVLALIAGLTCTVPYLGAAANAIAAGATAYLTAAESQQWTCVIAVVVSMVILNQVFDNLITPRLVGSKVGLHPLVVIFALMAGERLYGILGMILAVPVAGAFKVLLLHLFPKLQTPMSELLKLERRYRPKKRQE